MDFMTWLGLTDVDETKEYYTEEMLKDEGAAYIGYILIKKGIIQEKELIEYKEEFKKMRNEQIIKELKEQRERVKNKYPESKDE